MIARPDSQFLCCTCVYFLCDNVWPEVQSHSDDSHVHGTGPHYACALAQAHPTMSCIHLVINFWMPYLCGHMYETWALVYLSSPYSHIYVVAGKMCPQVLVPFYVHQHHRLET